MMSAEVTSFKSMEKCPYDKTCISIVMAVDIRVGYGVNCTTGYTITTISLQMLASQLFITSCRSSLARSCPQPVLVNKSTTPHPSTCLSRGCRRSAAPPWSPAALAS
ncbi:unnamed protein product [Chrysodeixis includens]|uniref:Uncharacterized protein n=1 Tax=Chrysodeixis includens TaxID=689277 RepID=A0A9N8KVU1_CHRIL|nr:unnamed protein product [Chrysodeixis includens]